MITEADNAREPIGVGASTPATRNPPTAQQLRELANSTNYAEAAALLDGVDLDAELGADFHYYAGVCLGSVGREEAAIGLLKRAVASGYAQFWCAYHLGLFEMRRGRIVNAAYYYTVSLILDPARADIYPLLERVAPKIDIAILHAAQAGTRSAAEARAALEGGEARRDAGDLGAAAFYFTIALALDPAHGEPRDRLWSLMPDISPALLPGIDDERRTADLTGAKPMAESASNPPPTAGKPPSARRLAMFANSARYAEAAALLEGVDLGADLPPDFLYYAGVCLGSVDQEQRAIDLLKRAVAGGYPRFWCAYHLGLFEEKLGNAGKAAYYYTASLISDPARSDIWELLVRVAPDTDFSVMREAQVGVRSSASARVAVQRGTEALQSGSMGAAACHFATALALDPMDERPRTGLLEFAPDLSLEALTGIVHDRLVARLHEELEAPASGADDLERKLQTAARLHSIMPVIWHARGHAMIPALERLLGRALATPGIALDPLCMLYDGLAFLYFYMAPHSSAMRGFAEHVVKPFAAAIRDGVGCEALAPIVRRPLGPQPLRLGYLSEFANRRPGNAVGPFIGHVMGGLSRNFPEAYRLFLYAWSGYDDDFLAEFGSFGISHRQFDDFSLTECIAAVALGIAEDEIDILITDMHSPLSTILFERRVAPVQIFYCMGGLPFWPLQNIDAVFRIDVYDPRLDDWDLDKCYPFGLGPWDVARLAPTVNPERIAAERARFPAGKRLIGNYGRLAKMTPDFLSIAAELAARHSDVVVVLGGTGNGSWIREFIASQGLTGRIELVEGFVDGHIWAHLIEVFLDTFPTEGGVSRREVMAKGKPVVTMLGPWARFEAVSMLVARERNGYVEIVSRLLAEPDFYDAAVAATRELIAFGMTDFDYASAVHDALTAIVDRSERSVNLQDCQE